MRNLRTTSITMEFKFANKGVKIVPIEDNSIDNNITIFAPNFIDNQPPGNFSLHFKIKDIKSTRRSTLFKFKLYT